MPLLSVIMSGYKAGETIEGAVRSTLRAMPRDSELVVAVDGPDAPTSSALARIDDRRLVVRESTQNMGLARQLVRLTDETDSRFLARMDSDDICLPWRFATSLPPLRGADFVFTSGIRFGQGRPCPSWPMPMGPYEVALALLFYNPLFHPSMVCRREALATIGGYATIPYGEDYELWLRAANAGMVMRKIATPGICYRLSPGQMSAGEGVDERLLAEPAVRSGMDLLANRFGLADRLGPDGLLRLGEDDVARLLAPVSRANRAHLHHQILDSPMCAGPAA